MIEIKKISYCYGKEKVLEDIEIDIKKGESVALIGPNGSGKSTLIKIINGIFFPKKGSYIYKGQEITEKSLSDSTFKKIFHKSIGFIFQNSEVQLFCTDVYDEIAFGPRQMGLSEEVVAKRVEDCIKLLEVDAIRGKAPFELSGGEMKRVAIASILSMNPEVLVLDEPLSNLTPRGKRFLKELFIKLNRSGKTILCATHDLNFVEEVFDRVILLSEEHKVVVDDGVKSVLANKKLLEENYII